MSRLAKLNRRHQLLLAVVLVQFAILLVLPLLHGARIAAGTEVRVAVAPVDPLDLARGAYVDLAYEFEQLPMPSGDPGFGEDAFVVLDEPADPTGEWRATKVVIDEGELDGVDAFIRLSVDGDGRLSTTRIDSFYEDPDDAIALEQDLADEGALAVLSLDEDGRPNLVDVEPH